MRLTIALCLALIALPGGAHAQAVEESAPEAEAAEPAPEDGSLPVDEQGPWPGVPQPPVYEEWWFWIAIGALTLGITAAIIVGVTTEHPASSRAGLVLRFD